jgi:hypothetical protein
VSTGRQHDKATWRVDIKPEATGSQQTAAAAAVTAYAAPTDPITDMVLTYPGFYDTTGRVEVIPELNPAQVTKVILAIGQSNIASSFDAKYTPTYQTLVQNLNIYDGRIYRLEDPVLGASHRFSEGSWLGRLGDKLIDAGYAQRVIVVPIALDGSSIAQWDGGALASRIIVAVNWCRRLKLPITHHIWMQGEKDNALGTAGATYTAALQAIVQRLRDAGETAPFMLSQTTWSSGTTSSTIRTAQANAVSGPLNIVLGPDTDTLTAGYRQADNTHFSVSGSNGVDACAGLWATAIAAL